ncbi:MAG: AAA family ATPase [Anaerolineae bacterium]|nr:AAA family ATPase [Anaerolineae bacterium]NIN97413.1 AAA family ATPase [Anaerolineae bacterium]NIQ80342.1 AAA family ATPase [Anaerolineae bacterium]
MDLFEYSVSDQLRKEAPLAVRMRPRTLDEMVGQEHIIGPGKLLRRAIEADRLGSIILWGPPGTGKTSLASVIANTTESAFEAMSAVTAGVKELRQLIAAAKNRRVLSGVRTILLVDEIHHFTKTQQDALLPHVEDGLITLIGITTENPYFEVIGALVSRSRIFRLEPLTEEEVSVIVKRALGDAKRGLGGRDVELHDDALAHMVRVAGGDARIALNALELAAETTEADEEGVIRVTLEIAEDSIQRRALLYDKDGDAHYDTISAFIKSVRGSDPDAALYWLAKMIYAGEDPRFIARRMIVLASEDIGNADPQALTVATSAAQALEWVGLPEAQYNLAQAAIYLATAPKSNSAGAYFKALADVEEQGIVEVPDHLKDSSRDREALGHGEDYKYPHQYPEHFVPQQYLPEELQGRRYYEPSDQGYEKEIKRRLGRWRCQEEES